MSLVKDKIKKVVLEEKFGGDKNKFVPTDIGEVVNDFLTDNLEKSWITVYGKSRRKLR
jgi:DNA topoisomerase-1